MAKKPTRPRKSRAKFSKRFTAAIKRVRAALAKLKRKKVIPKDYNVRKALPTSSTRKIVKRFEPIVSGTASSYSLPNDIPSQIVKDLKKLGYKVTGTKKEGNRRIIVPKTQYVRKGEVYERPTRSRKGYKIQRERLDMARIREQVEAAFEGLRPGDMAGFEVGDSQGKGGNSVSIYGDPNSMIRELMAYQERGFKFTHLAVFRLSKAKQKDYIEKASRKAREAIPGTPERRESLRRMARGRQQGTPYPKVPRKRNKGVRTSRGH